MSRIALSLTDENGVNIVDPTVLTDAVPMEGLSIDDDQIVGLDNFQVEAKRAKVTVRLLNKNVNFNNTLKSYLTNPDFLVPTIPAVKENFDCLLIDHARMMSIFSEKKLFARHFSGLTQSWDEDAGQGDLYSQSAMMVGIFYQVLITIMHGCSTNGIGTTFSLEPMDTICSMFLKMCCLNAPGTVYNEANLPAIVVQYLNSIKSGYGDITDNGQNVFVNFLKYPWFYRLLDYAGYYNIEQAINGFADHLVRDNANVTRFCVQTAGDDWEWINKSDIPDYSNITDVSYGSCVALALYLSSIIQYDLFRQLQTIYFNSNQDISLCTINRYSAGIQEAFNFCRIGTFVPFYKVPQVVLSGNIYSDNLVPANVVAHTSSNGTIYVSNKNRILDGLATIATPISFCKKDFGVAGIQFGKTQVRTETETTESGIPVVSDMTSVPTDSLFVPVERKFRIRALTQEQIDKGQPLLYVPGTNLTSQSYKFFLEDPNTFELFADERSESILKTGGWYSESNWMYFNNIYVTEELLDETDDTHVDNIPLFDIETGEAVDNFGLYIYRDYFDKFYSKEKSGLLNIYLRVSIDDTLLFTGIIDFSTVQVEKQSVSFEAIDGVGVLIDNLEKMDGFLAFSQFDMGDYITADKRAGMTLRTFLETVIRTPFPYRTRFANPAFTIPDGVDGLDNKILQDISASDAFMMAVQCCKRLLFADAEGRIDFADIADSECKTIDGEILSISEKYELDREVFNADKLKYIAGYNRFVPSIVSYYMRLRELAVKELNIQVYNQQEEIKILDNIEINNEVYIVTGKNFLFRRR